MPPTFAQWLAAEVCEYCGWTRICELPRVLLAKGRQPFAYTYIVQGETLRQLHNIANTMAEHGLDALLRDVAWGRWARYGYVGGHLGNPQLDEHARPKGSELNARWAALRPRVLEARARARETARLLAHHVTAR